MVSEVSLVNMSEVCSPEPSSSVDVRTELESVTDGLSELDDSSVLSNFDVSSTMMVVFSVMKREETVAGVTEEVWVIISEVFSPELSSAKSWVPVVGFPVLYREEVAVTAVFDESDGSDPCDAVVTTGFSVLDREEAAVMAVVKSSVPV